MSYKKWIYDTEVEGTKILGQTDRKRIVKVKIDRLRREIIEELYKIPDVTCFAADILDETGISGSIPASVLKPLKQGQKAIGQAITLRNAPFRQNLVGGYRDKSLVEMGDRDASYIAEPGDVLVIEGVHNYSNMGEMSALTAKAEGLAGVVCDGAVRDVGSLLQMDLPVWYSDLTPITGKFRTMTLAINSEVKIAGVQVHPGDLVVADDSGVVFVPIDKVETILEISKKQEVIEEKMRKAIANHDLEGIRRLFGERYYTSVNRK